MCLSASFRTFLGAAAAYVWLSCHVSCSYFRSMPSRLLRTSVDWSDEAFLGCCADNQISLYLPAIHAANLVPFSLILSIQVRLVPSSTCTHISLPSRLLFRSRRRHAPMHHASNSDLLTFPLQQQPLSRPPTSPPRPHRSSAPASPCLLVFYSFSDTRPCSMQRPQTFSPFRSSSSLSADCLALACPRHQRPAFVLESHAKGEEPRWVMRYGALEESELRQ